MRMLTDRPVTIALYFFTLCVASISSLQIISSENYSFYGDFNTPYMEYEYEYDEYSIVHTVQRRLYNKTSVSIWVRDCIGNDSNYTVNWVIREMECFNKYIRHPLIEKDSKLKGEGQFWYYKSVFPVTQTCGENALALRDETGENWIAVPPIPLNSKRNTGEVESYHSNVTKNKVTEVPRDGNYLLFVYIWSDTKIPSQVDIEIEFQSQRGFPSRYPDNVLLFYDAMCCVYGLETIIWFVLVACNWKSLLRIHHLMNFVLLINVLASILDAIRHDMHNRWVGVKNVELAFQVVFRFQTSLCLFFMIVFSLGDGITKPRLSRCSCAFASLTTLIVFLFISCPIVYDSYHDSHFTKNILLDDIAKILILVGVVFGVVLVIWVCINLIRTIRQLHRQKQLTKKILYIFVTIGLVLYVVTNIAAIAMNIYQTYTCSHVTGVLIDEGAYVPVILSAFLLIVIVLIRPTSSNLGFLRYEILIDKSEDSNSDNDEDEDILTRRKQETGV